MKLTNFNDLPDFQDDEVFEEQRVRPYLEETRSLKKFPIPNYPMFIGRDKKGSICIPIAGVSRRHAKVFERDGKFYIQDDGSINGTYLNEKRIIETVEIKEGDRLKIGQNNIYPKGIREYVFKYDISKQQNLDKLKLEEEIRKQEEGKKLLQEAGISEEFSTNKILLKDCICSVNKKDFGIVLIEKPQRVPLCQIDLEKKVLDFLSLCSFKPKENLMFSIKHPRLENIKIPIKILDVKKHPYHDILINKSQIMKVSDSVKNVFEDKIEAKPLICYVTSKLKE